MQLSKATAYGVLASAFIAEHGDAEPVRGRVIAEALEIPPEYLLKVLQQLVRARVLESETGRRGGFMLRKSAERTTLLQIVEAIDGPINGELSACRTSSRAALPRARIEAICQDAARYTKSLLGEATIQHVITPDS